MNNKPIPAEPLWEYGDPFCIYDDYLSISAETEAAVWTRMEEMRPNGWEPFRQLEKMLIGGKPYFELHIIHRNPFPGSIRHERMG